MATELVKVSEAAIRLGVSEKTILRHLRKGELKGHREPTPQGYTWLVEVLRGQDNQEDIDPAIGRVNGQVREDKEVLRLEELVEELRARVQAQEGQLEASRKDFYAQLEAKDRQIEQLHVLLQQAQAALPAPKESKGWWRRLWRR